MSKGLKSSALFMNCCIIPNSCFPLCARNLLDDTLYMQAHLDEYLFEHNLIF